MIYGPDSSEGTLQEKSSILDSSSVSSEHNKDRSVNERQSEEDHHATSEEIDRMLEKSNSGSDFLEETIEKQNNMSEESFDQIDTNEKDKGQSDTVTSLLDYVLQRDAIRKSDKNYVSDQQDEIIGKQSNMSEESLERRKAITGKSPEETQERGYQTASDASKSSTEGFHSKPKNSVLKGGMSEHSSEETREVKTLKTEKEDDNGDQTEDLFEEKYNPEEAIEISNKRSMETTDSKEHKSDEIMKIVHRLKEKLESLDQSEEKDSILKHLLTTENSGEDKSQIFKDLQSAAATSEEDNKHSEYSMTEYALSQENLPKIDDKKDHSSTNSLSNDEGKRSDGSDKERSDRHKNRSKIFSGWRGLNIPG